jgi:3'-phosphoadenosine 5'-phosphosulfate sulfotransferase (PAPS reductase)/FAD synthetase
MATRNVPAGPGELRPAPAGPAAPPPPAAAASPARDSGRFARTLADQTAERGGRCALFAAELAQAPGPVPDLNGYHWIVISISGGADSQAALDVTVAEADRQGVLRSRLVTVFADLGSDDEHPGTAELAAEHAAHYGLRHERVFRQVPDGHGGSVQQGLGAHIEQRGKWPDAKRRYCTSDLKRGPIWKLFTRLAAEAREAGVSGRARILDVQGKRAQESPERRKMAPFTPNVRASNLTVREVDTWLPIHHWLKEQVFERCAQAGTRVHPVYQHLGRVSCVACVLAPRSALIRAAQLYPETFARLLEREQRMDHTFRAGLSIAEIIDAARAAGPLDDSPAEDWRD